MKFSPSTFIYYQLVKSYNLNNQVLNDTFNYDGENGPDLFIVTNLTSSSIAGAVGMQLNGDASSNYQYNYIEQSDSNIYNSHAVDNIMHVGKTGDNNSSSISNCHLYLKTGGIRRFTMDGYRSVSGKQYMEHWAGLWNNTSDPVESITVTTLGSVTGSINIYALAKAQMQVWTE